VRAAAGAQHMSLGVALRYVLEALRTPPGSKLFVFAVEALRCFAEQLPQWPTYCSHLLQARALRRPGPRRAAALSAWRALCKGGRLRAVCVGMYSLFALKHSGQRRCCWVPRCDALVSAKAKRYGPVSPMLFRLCMSCRPSNAVHIHRVSAWCALPGLSCTQIRLERCGYSQHDGSRRCQHSAAPTRSSRSAASASWRPRRRPRAPPPPRLQRPPRPPTAPAPASRPPPSSRPRPRPAPAPPQEQGRGMTPRAPPSGPRPPRLLRLQPPPMRGRRRPGRMLRPRPGPASARRRRRRPRQGRRRPRRSRAGRWATARARTCGSARTRRWRARRSRRRRAASPARASWAARTARAASRPPRRSWIPTVPSRRGPAPASARREPAVMASRSPAPLVRGWPAAV